YLARHGPRDRLTRDRVSQLWIIAGEVGRHFLPGHSFVARAMHELRAVIDRARIPGRDLHGRDTLKAVQKVRGDVAVERLRADPVLLFLSRTKAHAAELSFAGTVDRVRVVGCGMIGPVSQPGPFRHSSACPEFRGSDGAITVVLSCCAP